MSDEVLVTLRMRRFENPNTGGVVYVSARNEYSCLSIAADLPEVVSVVQAPNQDPAPFSAHCVDTCAAAARAPGVFVACTNGQCLFGEYEKGHLRHNQRGGSSDDADG